MRYARIANGRLVEISADTEETIEEWRTRFHPTNRWVPYVDGANEGDTYDEQTGEFSPPPRPPIEDIRRLAIARVNNAAGAARLRFVTNSPYQQTEYDLTYEEALAYRADGYTGDVPAMVQAEADAQRITARQATDFIIATADGWRAAAAAIKRIRRVAIVAIEAAATESDANTLAEDADTALEVIRPA